MRRLYYKLFSVDVLLCKTQILVILSSRVLVVYVSKYLWTLAEDRSIEVLHQ
jgi:hypothetical protein